MNEPLRSRAALKRENETLSEIAAQESLRRSAAEDLAALEISQRRQAENATVDARIAANQAGFQAAQLNTEREILRDNLAAERTAASKANFGLTLLAAIALVGLLAFGIWHATGGNRTAARAASAGAATQTARDEANPAGRAAIVTSPAPSKSTRSEYHPAAPAVKVSAAKPHTAKSAAPRPSKTPASDSAAPDSGVGDDDASDDADGAADSNSPDDSSDASGADAKTPADPTGK